MKFTKCEIRESLKEVVLFAEGDSSSSDTSENTGACKNETNVNVNGCTR